MAMVTIDGIAVDEADPCAMAGALRAALLRMATGGVVSMTRFGEDEVRFGAANAGLLRDLLETYERKCAAKQGRRTRFAKRMRFVR